MTIPYKPQQSPIDLGLATPIAAVFPPEYLELRWGGHLDGVPDGEPGHIKFVFNKLKAGVGLSLGGQFFRLLQFHFHAPSEHKVSRKSWPLELHIVHQKPKTESLVVLGIMVEEGHGHPEAHRFFREFVDCYAEKASPATISIDPHDLLPENRGDFFRYEGSLTTKADEDNDETVSWVIFREPLRVDRATLRKFIGLGHQAKKLQELHRRFVLTSFVPPV